MFLRRFEVGPVSAQGSAFHESTTARTLVRNWVIFRIQARLNRGYDPGFNSTCAIQLVVSAKYFVRIPLRDFVALSLPAGTDIGYSDHQPTPRYSHKVSRVCLRTSQMMASLPFSRQQRPRRSRRQFGSRRWALPAPAIGPGIGVLAENPPCRTGEGASSV